MTKRNAQIAVHSQRSMVTVERMAIHSVNFAGMSMLINATDAQKNAKSEQDQLATMFTRRCGTMIIFRMVLSFMRSAIFLSASAAASIVVSSASAGKVMRERALPSI